LPSGRRTNEALPLAVRPGYLRCDRHSRHSLRHPQEPRRPNRPLAPFAEPARPRSCGRHFASLPEVVHSAFNKSAIAGCR